MVTRRLIDPAERQKEGKNGDLTVGFRLSRIGFIRL
jgi:hypothetical protein